MRNPQITEGLELNFGMMEGGCEKFTWAAKVGRQLHPLWISSKLDVRDAYQSMKRSVIFDEMVKADHTCGPHVADQLTDTNIHCAGKDSGTREDNEVHYTIA
jgi:hypothetical protein